MLSGVGFTGGDAAYVRRPPCYGETVRQHTRDTGSGGRLDKDKGQPWRCDQSGKGTPCSVLTQWFQRVGTMYIMLTKCVGCLRLSGGRCRNKLPLPTSQANLANDCKLSLPTSTRTGTLPHR